ncbi:MAG: PLP-dependent lyase/thiolase [Gemmataceae bacterium]
MLPPVRTPLVRLSNIFPDQAIYAKCELLAPGGSFKIHGAVHLLNHLSQETPRRTLVVPSMGNTALGAAYGAKAYGFSMVGVVPQAISKAKDEKLQALGVELIKIAGGGSELLNRAKQIAGERQGYFVHPHLDPLWTDGYFTIAEQILEALPECRTLVFPVGGGGLLMGSSEYILQHKARVHLVGCEAFNFPTYARYDHARTKTIADGLILDDPHPKVQERIKEMGIPINLVKDSEIRLAMAELYQKHGLVVEPSSAITVSFVKTNGKSLEAPACLVMTGGNIGAEDFQKLIGSNSF